MADYAKTFDVIAATTDVKKIQQIIANTQKLHGPDHPVVLAGRERLKKLLGPDGVIQDEFEVMRKATVEVTGNDGRLSRLRQARAVIGALEYLMAKPEPSPAFHKLMAAGREDETAEAIVIRHAAHFSPAAVATAHKRLEK